MTYSLESALVRAHSLAAVAIQGVLDVVGTVEKLTRPVRGGEVDDAELEPIDRCYFGHHSLSTCLQDCQCTEAPNPTEPGLSDDELVGVRQMIEERFGEEQNPFIARLAERVTATEQLGQIHAMSRRIAAEYTPPTSASAIPSSGADAEPTAPADFYSAGSSGEAGQPPVSASPRFGRSTSAIHDVIAHPDDAAAEWVGGAVPVISEVLAEHQLFHEGGSEYVCCAPGYPPHVRVWSQDEWRAHISPILANALAPHPKPASAETGYDMGGRWAAEMYPQHKSKGTQ